MHCKGRCQCSITRRFLFAVTASRRGDRGKESQIVRWAARRPRKPLVGMLMMMVVLMLMVMMLQIKMTVMVMRMPVKVMMKVVMMLSRRAKSRRNGIQRVRSEA